MNKRLASALLVVGLLVALSGMASADTSSQEVTIQVNVPMLLELELHSNETIVFDTEDWQYWDTTEILGKTYNQVQATSIFVAGSSNANGHLRVLSNVPDWSLTVQASSSTGYFDDFGHLGIRWKNKQGQLHDDAVISADSLNKQITFTNSRGVWPLEAEYQLVAPMALSAGNQQISLVYTLTAM